MGWPGGAGPYGHPPWLAGVGSPAGLERAGSGGEPSAPPEAPQAVATHMYGLIGTLIRVKTTIDLNDELFRRAKQVAAVEGTTLRQLVESGLRAELARRESGDFTLLDASFGGRGVQPGIDEGDWDSIREAIYAGRGG